MEWRLAVRDRRHARWVKCARDGDQLAMARLYDELYPGIAACTTPTDYDVEVGEKMTISFADAAKSENVDALIEEVAAYAETLDGAGGLRVLTRR